MDIDHLKSSILHSKVAVFAIVGFLTLVTLLIVIMARVSTEQALTNQSSASMRGSNIRVGGQGEGYGGERVVIPSPALREAGTYKDIELKTVDSSPQGGVSVQSCMMFPGRKCLPKNTCMPPNGTEVPGGGNCVANGSYIPDTVCCDQNANKDKGVTGEYNDYLIVKEFECVKYGGQCKKGVEPDETSANCPINFGLCSDDGVSTRGVCCLEKGGPTSTPVPTVNISSPIETAQCQALGGSCESTHGYNCWNNRCVSGQSGKRYKRLGGSCSQNGVVIIGSGCCTVVDDPSCL